MNNQWRMACKARRSGRVWEGETLPVERAKRAIAGSRRCEIPEELDGRCRPWSVPSQIDDDCL